MKRKIRKFGGGGTMGASDRGYQGGGRDSKGSVSGSAPGAGGSTNTGGSGNKLLNLQALKHTRDQKIFLKVLIETCLSINLLVINLKLQLLL